MRLIKKLTYFVGGLSMALLSISFAGQVMAWGPERPTFTINSPATYPTFNSITDNPAYGDERNFLRLKEATAGDGAYSDETKIVPGKEYIAYVYFHNNASATFNDAAHNYSGLAKNTRLRVALPDQLLAGKRTGMTGYITANNAKPSSVYDDTYMTADSDVALRYVPGTAIIASKGAVNGQKVADSVITDGAPLGYSSLDGTLPGCHEFAGYVTLRFKAVAPDFSVTKQVSAYGQKKYGATLAAKVGDKVDFLISYKNIGSVRQDNVLVKDVLPSGLVYEAGSSVLANTANPGGAKTDDGVTAKGLNIGSYAPDGNAYLRFTAKVTDPLPACGLNTLRNIVTVITGNGNKSAEATVTVESICKPDECLPGVSKGDERCNLTTLPSTGPLELTITAIVVAAISLATFYWYNSRRQLRGSLKKLPHVDAPKE